MAKQRTAQLNYSELMESMLDEPGAGLVDEETEQLAGLIRQIPERYGAQVILVDHDMELVSAVCSTLSPCSP